MPRSRELPKPTIAASAFYQHLRPKRCDRRLYFAARDEGRVELGAFEELVIRWGLDHERRHLESFDAVVDLSKGPRAQRAAATRRAVIERAAVLYQPAFETSFEAGGAEVAVVGEPDFLVLGDDGHYAIREAKLARNTEEARHPEIHAQLATYGWLFRRSFPDFDFRLEVWSGNEEVVPVDYPGCDHVASVLEGIHDIRSAEAPPDEPLGWSKCSTCPYYAVCWPEGEARRDVSLLPDVDQNLARELYAQGIRSYDSLVESYDVDSLGALQRPWGARRQRVGSKAAKILRQARAMATQEVVWHEDAPPPPDHPNFVMFDLEGIPPHIEDWTKIYLWGMQVFGANPGAYRPAIAGLGEGGDEAGWREFLAIAAELFTEHGDIPFVHWAPYERTQLRGYVERFGDPDGVAERVERNLLDLLGVVQASASLPLPSYSLKVVEQFVGFERSQVEYGGEWSIAMFIEACESDDAAVREANMAAIRRYNEEDLEATWAVLEWLLSARQ